MRLARRTGGLLQRQAVTLAIGVTLSLCALGFPIDAMNLTSPRPSATGAGIPPPAVTRESFPIFTTPTTRQSFLAPEKSRRTFTLELAKEEFFRTEVPFGTIIYQEARRNNLPPELVAAVVEAESDFRPRLVSEKDARGLMQIVPETGRLLGCSQLFNPTENIAAGTRYLRYLLDRFGDQRMALAAYNAGLGNVERFGGIPPFPETINYVQRVAQGTRAYRQRIHNRYAASVRLRTSMLE